MVIVCVLSLLGAAEVLAQQALPQTSYSVTSAKNAIANTINALQPQYRFEHLSQEQGLSYNTVTSFAQDHNGFLWIGTFDGLNRFDGINFKVFRRTNNDSTPSAQALLPSSNRIRLLYTDRIGDIWIVQFDNDNPLQRFNPRTERFVPVQTKGIFAKQESVASIAEDANGTLWLTSSQHLYTFNRSTQALERFVVQKASGLAPSTLASTTLGTATLGVLGDVVECATTERHSPERRLWIRTEGGLLEIDTKRGAVSHHAMTDAKLDRQHFFAGIARDSSGYVWFSDIGHLYCFDVRSKSVVARYPQELYIRQSLFKNPPKNDFRFWTIMCAPNGTLWLGCGGGIVVVKYAADPRNASLQLLQHDDAEPTSLSGNPVRALFADRSGVIWAGGEPFGINKYTPYKQKFLLFRHSSLSENTLGNNYVRGICQTRDGTLWVATHFGGISRYDPRSGRWTRFRDDLDKTIPPNLRLPVNEIWSIYEDHEGVVWAGTRGKGLLRFHAARQRFEQSSLVPESSIVQVITEDRTGKLLLGMRGNSQLRDLYVDVYEIPRTRTKRGVRAFATHRPETPDFLGGDVMAIHEDRAGMLWIGSTRKLLVFDRTTGATTDYTKALLNASDASVPVTGSAVSSILEDHEGNVWITSKGVGLRRYDRARNRFVSVTERDGLPNNSVYAALEDGRGNFWISSDEGLSLWNRSANTFRTFTTDDGLQGREFNRRSFFKSANGMMFFGGTNGLNAFHPDSLHFNPFAPSVALTSFKIFANEQNINSLQQRSADGTTITLTHDQNFLTFQFAALDFHVPQNNKYAYKLEGVDKHWVHNGTKREAVYTNLSAGEYVFRVRAANNDGIWNMDGLALRVTILPPWWATWWFRALLMLGAVGVFAAVVQSYRSRIQRLQQHRTELMQHIEERRRAEEELQRSEEKFRILFETSSLGMVLWESDGRVLEANAAFAHVTGYTAHEISATNFWAMLNEAHNATIQYSLQQRGAFGPVEQVLTQKNGGKLSIMLYGIVAAKGAVWLDNDRIWTVVEDITERKRAVDAMLRYQLNPHFMFNVLNSVNALMSENQRNAKRMIIQFSSLLRHTLVASSKQTAPLGDEMEAVEHYVAIEKLRFEERLEAHVQAERATLGLNVPVFLVQPLVENAIKYGMQTTENVLNIEVVSRLQDEHLLIEVSNTGVWLGAGAHIQFNDQTTPNGSNGSRADASAPRSQRRSTGIGLENLRKRLQQMYPEGHSMTIAQEQGRVVVRICIAIRELMSAPSE
jgi:PAS domain S-box-containing protein